MDLIHIFYWTFAYDFIRGPMVWVSFVVFVFGILFQVFRFLSLTRKQNRIVLKPGPGNFIKNKPSSQDKSGDKPNWLALFGQSIAGVNPFMVIVTTVFHVILVLLPIFVLAHNMLMENAFGISMASLPENISDFLTCIILITMLIFFYRRIFLYRVKIITTFEDYLILFLVAVPFLTGYFAYHQIFDYYKLMIGLHILSGEVMLMAVPFTKFVHMIYFIIVRFTIAGEYSLGKGNRTW